MNINYVLKMNESSNELFFQVLDVLTGSSKDRVKLKLTQLLLGFKKCVDFFWP